jgi:cytosolic phospholipase A2
LAQITYTLLPPFPNSHNPHDEETEEQIAYEKEMYSRYFSSAGAEEPQDNASGDGERGLFGKGSGAPGSGSGSSLGASVKGIFSDGKAAVRSIKSFITLDNKLSKDLYDPSIFPEVAHQAHVRRGIDLAPDEAAFVADRKAHVRDRFAAYMGWDPSQVHPDDVPTVAFGGSGGGYRAMLAVMGYGAAMKKTGLWDLLTYVSGVSGSCECCLRLCRSRNVWFSEGRQYSMQQAGPSARITRLVAAIGTR